MNFRLTIPLAILLLSGTSAMALTAQELADRFAAEGFTRVEVKRGPSQIKVEAIRGTEKIETVYDAATGAVLSREVEAVEDGDDTTPGVEIDEEDEDFTDDDGDDDADDDDSDDDDDGDDDGDDGDSDDDDGDDGDSDDDDGDDDHAGHDDDDGDDDHRGRGRGRGGDDGDDDDDHRGRGGDRDDDHDDDH